MKEILSIFSKVVGHIDDVINIEHAFSSDNRLLLLKTVAADIFSDIESKCSSEEEGEETSV